MEAVLPLPVVDVKKGVTINVKKTKSLFDSIFRTINYSTVLPILEDVLVIRRNNRIFYCATDLQNTLSIGLVDHGPDMSIVFPGVELKYLLKYAYTDEIYFEENKVKGGASLLSVSAGKFNLMLTPSKVEEYPKFPILESKKKLTVDTNNLVPILENVLKFVSNDDLRPSMIGVCFKDIGGKLFIAATDAHRLYWESFCNTPAAWEGCCFIVPAKSVSLIISAFRNEAHVSLTLEEPNYLMASAEDKEFTCRLIDARYPDFYQVIPSGHPLQFGIRRSDFIKTLKLCMPFTNKSTKQIGVEVYSDRLDFSGGDGDFYIEFKDSLSIKSPTMDTFTPFKFGINAKFLISSLECSDEEYVKVSSSMNPLHAIIIDENNLIMPLSLNQ